MDKEKTNEKFRSVQRTFVYTPKSAFTNQLSSLAFGIGMIVLPLAILPNGILSTILVVGGALLLVMTFFSIRKARILAAKGGSITIDKGRVTYPKVSKGEISYDSFLISDIRTIEDDDDENQCKVDLPDKYIVFEIKYFSSQDEFDEFRSLLG
jgi:hypothetical protein